MAHDLDTTDGITSFADSRNDAWHQLGQKLNKVFTAEEAMEKAYLGGWDVRKIEPSVTAEDGTVIPMVGRAATVRTNPVNGKTEFLGDVGTNYSVIQNEQHAEFLNALVDEGGAHFETAGALNGGRTVFMSMLIPSHIKIGGVDPVECYLNGINTHDGSMSYTTIVTPVRTVCSNTLNWALDASTGIFRVRHTSGAVKAVQKAREVLDLTFAHMEEFQSEAEKLIQTSLTQQAFEKLISEAFGAPEDSPAATITRTDAKLDKMAELFADASTQAGVRNTAWAGLNAITEWYDHFSPVLGDDRDNSRAQKAILEPAFKTQAHKLMMALV